MKPKSSDYFVSLSAVLGCFYGGCATKASRNSDAESVPVASFQAAAPTARPAAPVAASHSVSVGPKIVATTDAERAEVAGLLVFLKSLKTSGHDFDRIVQIDFESSVQATAQFTWSGGFHGGVFYVIKKAGVWTLRDEAYLL